LVIRNNPKIYNVSLPYSIYVGPWRSADKIVTS
jgi:hypothetical protein